MINKNFSTMPAKELSKATERCFMCDNKDTAIKELVEALEEIATKPRGNAFAVAKELRETAANALAKHKKRNPLVRGGALTV